jgi:ribosomal protein S6--L-glutamate ligase
MTRGFLAVAPAHVAHTLILPAEPRAAEQALDELGLPLVVKRPRSAMGRGVAVIERRSQLHDWCRGAEVLYAQEYLPSEADLRVVWVGDRVVAAYWRRGGDDFRHNLTRGADADFGAVPVPATALVGTVARGLGIDHAGFDLILVGGYPYLIELNVLFGNEALNACGIRLAPVILDYLERTLRPGSDPAPPLQRAT